jgi:phosphopantetheinyl transferase
MHHVVVREPPVPPGTDVYFDVEDRGGLAIRIGVRKDGGIPSGRDGRRQAQRVQVRSLCRRMLESMHGHDAAGWTLSKTELGQPFLGGAGAPRISLAHSGPWLACAASAAGCVGVDVESVRPRNWASLHDQFLHPREAEWVMAAAGHERDVRAYTCWCRKEAGLKALGIGAAVPLDGMAFSPEGQLVIAPAVFGHCDAWHTKTWTLDSAVLAVAWAPDARRRF